MKGKAPALKPTELKIGRPKEVMHWEVTDDNGKVVAKGSQPFKVEGLNPEQSYKAMMYFSEEPKDE